jgi:phosphatidylglycerol:prolipoprotein diacylglycerol transferase
MLKYPEIDPVAFSLGPLEVHWYGIMYLCAFAAAWLLALYRARQPHSPIKPRQVEDLIFWGALGVVIGGRVGYVLFYNLGAFFDNPLMLFRVWDGGMSFHGGMLGVIIAVWLYSRKIGQHFLDMADFVAPLAPLGLGFGRIGNFIGQELWGRPTDPDAPWAVVFPRDPEGLYRHPSQLYQAFLEGLVLFIILFWFSRKPRPRAAVSALFLILYGLFRFIVEFVRTPDAHIGFDMFGWMTRGQVLSLPMILLGLVIFVWVYVKSRSGEARQFKGSL